MIKSCWVSHLKGKYCSIHSKIILQCGEEGDDSELGIELMGCIATEGDLNQ